MKRRWWIPALLLAMASAARAQDTSLTVGFAAEATTLDPVKYSAGADGYGMSQMFEQLMRPVPPDWKQANWLAESWSIGGTPDRPVVDVHIRPHVLFHNGDKLTADDFQYAYEQQRDPKESHFSHLWTAVEQFEVVSPLHFRLHLREPDGTLIVDNLRLWALPRRYRESVGAEAFGRAPVGTGPWRFISRRVKEEMRLEAFDGYWNQKQRPRLHTLVIKTIPEDLTRVAALKTGAVDLIDSVPVAMLGEIRALPGLKTATLNTGNNIYFNLYTGPGSPFRDVRVREAATLAVDVDTIIAKVLFGQAERYTEVGRDTFGYDAALRPRPYEPKRARTLLAEAGFPRGFDIPCYNMTTPREPNIKELGEAVFAYLSSVGIRCKVRGLEYNAWLITIRHNTDATRQMDGVINGMYGHGIPGDPGTAWAQTLHSYTPGGGWGASSQTEDPEIDALIEAQKREMDIPKRETILRRIARLKYDRFLGGLSIYRPLMTFAWRDRVDFTPWAMPGIWHQMQEIGLAR
jgi:peptide/nickel transport system substrate-binding protein